MNSEISIGKPGEMERPKWCPLYGQEDPDNEPVEYV